MLERPSEYEKMAAVEGTHWWYRSLHRLVARALAKYGPGSSPVILDAGCGTGGLLGFLAARGFRNVSGVDLSPVAVAICRERGLDVRQANLLELNGLLPPSSVQVIISNDTLYFFSAAEQERILDQCWQALSPAGLLLMNLPAFQIFRGSHDLAVGIQRRFSRPEALRLLRNAGFAVRVARAWPFLLSPAILAARSVQRLRMRSASPSEPSSDLWLPPAPLNAMFAAITALELNLPPLVPFASSLFIVAQKPGDR